MTQHIDYWNLFRERHKKELKEKNKISISNVPDIDMVCIASKLIFKKKISYYYIKCPKT